MSKGFEFILLKRQKDRSIQTFGDLSFSQFTKYGQIDFSCKTLELKWNNNKRNESCYPDGIYSWIKRKATSAIPYEHILILDVKDRAGICIHYGNYAAGLKPDVAGCTLVGWDYKDINNDGYLDIINSKRTFDFMMSLLPDSGKIVVITLD